MLDLTADSVTNSRVLLLVNYRPEYRHEWTNKSYYSQLRLDPLGGADGAAMLAALLGQSVELTPLKRLIAERIGGNPFFIEEKVQVLFDEGTLVRNGAVKVTRSLSQLRLPTTVQGILAARIDRQPSKHKQLLQTLAVIGRESSLGLIKQVVPSMEAQLERMLAHLQAGEFIYEQPALGDIEFVFKHALTQEVAYNSLLIERRKLLHERAGQALEAIFAEQLDDHLTQLAHHFRHSDNLDKAVEYLGRAGQQALQRSANADAINSLTAAIDLLTRLPDNPERTRRELSIQLTLGPALMSIGGWAGPEVERAYARMRELCESLGDPPEVFQVLAGLFFVYLLQADLHTARELAERMRRRAELAQKPELLMQAYKALGQVCYYLLIAELLPAKKYLEVAISIYNRENGQQFTRYGGVDLGVATLSAAAVNLWLLGYPDQALKTINEAQALAQALSHPSSIAFSLNFMGVLHQYRREVLAVKETTERLISMATEDGLAFWLAVATSRFSWAVAGEDVRAPAQMHKGVSALRATGTQLDRPYWSCLLAETYAKTNLLDEGLVAVKEALADADGSEDRDYQAEVYRVKGELLLRQNQSNFVEAQSCFERAIEIARQQSARSWELRATISLARLLDQQRRREEARTMLAEIYNWFTEGFDTADLRDAEVLLDELSN